MKVYSYLLLALLCCKTIYAQVPKVGVDTLMDIACWNVEWLGNTSNGPSDEALQFANVKQVLVNTDIDVWGLCEVSDNTAYVSLMGQLPQYGSVISSFSQTQKTALFYKSAMFQYLASGPVLNQSQYDYDFAGRPPLEVLLKLKQTGDTIYFYVVHLKAISEQASYDRRKNASGHMKSFLDANRAGKKVMVLGDWNDDLDMATFGGLPSPFQNFLTDTGNYFFTTKQLSDAGKKSYAFINGSMIDHHLISKSMKAMYKSNSSLVLDNMSSYINNFSNNTSDHYPVVSFFQIKPVVTTKITESITKSEKQLMQSPDGKTIYLKSDEAGELVVTDISGKQIDLPQTHAASITVLDISELYPGIYILSNTKYGRVSLERFVKFK